MAQGQPNMVEQWVFKILNYSSQYDNSGWSAKSVIGVPKVYPKYGDKSGAWAQGTKDANQFIEVEFAEKVYITKIDIYETYHAGAVKRIMAKQPNDSWYTVWETSGVFDIQSSRIFSPTFPSLTFESNALRIQVDCTAAKSWVEIDAVKIYGSKGSFPVSQQVTARSNPVNNSTHTEQWVSRVINYSSQYDDVSWPATAVVGEPKVYPNYGDNAGAWAQGTRDAHQFIEVEFQQKVYITKVEIYETYNAGGVKRIMAKQPNGNWKTIWETVDVYHLATCNIFSPTIQNPTFESNVLRIEVDCSKSGSWVEIDAIKLHGNKGAIPKTQQAQQAVSASKPYPVHNPNRVEQWVSKVVNFSSQYNSTSWSASSVEGVPKVYPRYGDIAGAWAMKKIDANQFLELEYAEKIFIDKIDIYETYHTGGVKRIRAKRPDGSWFTVWETPRVFCQKSSRIFSPQFQKLPFHCNILRIDVDCTGCNTWVEIDAVKIIGTKFNFDLPPADTDITLDLVKLVNNPLYSDIKFDVNGAIFYGHRALLSVRSDYFNAMFNFDAANRPQVPTTPYPQPSAPPQGAMSAPEYPPDAHLYPPSYEAVMSGNDNMPSNVPPEAVYQPASQTAVPLKDVDPRAFAVILHYVYTNKLPSSCQSQILPAVWRTADRFALEGLKSLSIMEISSKLTVDNVVDVYVDVISALPVIDGLKQMCEMFMQDNMKEIVRHKSFRSLPQDITVELIQMMTQNLDLNR